MKKKILSVLLAFVMIVGLLPTAAFAAGSDHEIWLKLVKDSTTFTGKTVLRVDYMYKSGTDATKSQEVWIKFDASKLTLLYNQGKGGVDGSEALTSLSTPITDYFMDNLYSNGLTGINNIKNSMGIMYGVLSNGYGYIDWKNELNKKGSPLADFTAMSSIFFELKTGVSFDSFPKDAISFATPANDKTVTSQTYTACVSNDDEIFLWNSEGTDSLTVAPTIVTGDGVSFAKTALNTTSAALNWYFADSHDATSGSQAEADAHVGKYLRVKVVDFPEDAGDITITVNEENSTSQSPLVTQSVTSGYLTSHLLDNANRVIGKKLKITVTCENYSGSLTATTPVIQKAPQTGCPTLGQVENGYDYTTNKPVIRVNIAEDTQWTIVEGTASPSADAVWVNYPSSGIMVDGKRQYEFAGLKADTTYTVYARYKESDTHLAGTSYGSIAVETREAAITDISGVSVAAPVKGTALATGITDGDATKYTGTVTWYEGTDTTGEAVTDTNAKASTVYTAKITLTADRTASAEKDRQHFAADSFISTPTGYTLVSNDHVDIVLTKTFPATLEKTLQSIAISGAASLIVPTKAELEAYGANSNNYYVAPTYDDGSSGDITSGVAWEIVESTHTGVTLTPYDGQGTANLAADNTATLTSVTIKATYGGKSATKTITLTKDEPELTAMTISGDTSIAVPTSGSTEKTYTVSGEDQYGAAFTPTGVTWSVSTATGVSIDSDTGKLTVTNAAQRGTVTVTATYGSDATAVTATKAVAITRDASVPTTVEISGDDEVTIPVAKADMTPDSATASYTATVKDQYGQTMTGQTVTWSVSASDASISSSGVLTVTSSTAQDTMNKVTATVSGTTVSGEKTVKLMRSGPYMPKFVKIFKNGAAVSTDSIVIPSGEDLNTASYTATVYNQYGEEYESSLSWSLTDATGVMLDSSSSPVQVKVGSSASETTLTLEAKVNDTVKATVSISLVNKQPATVSINRSGATNVTYGTSFTLSATAENADGTALTGGTWTWSSSDESVLRHTGGDVSTNSATFYPEKAYNNSAAPVTITATYVDENYGGSASTSFTLVNQRVITVSVGTAKVSKVYDGTVTAVASNITGTPGIDRTNVLTGDTSKVIVGYSPAAYTSKNVHTGNTTLNFTLSGDAAANYKLNTSTVTVPCEITKREISVDSGSGASIADKSYDGNRNATVNSVTFTGLVDGETLDKDTDYVASAVFPDANADENKVNVTVTVQLRDTDKANNYKLSNFGGNYTVYRAAKITKADYTGTPSKTVNIVKNNPAAQTGSFTAADFFTTAPDGAKITSIATTDTSLDVIASISIDESTGTLSYTSESNITATENDTYTVTISSTNYNNIDAELKFRPVDKTDAGVAIADATASTTYGTNITLAATKATDKTGTWSWSFDSDYFQAVGAINGASITLKPLKANLTGTTVTATYEGDDVAGSDSISVTINKADLVVTALDQSIQVGVAAPDLTDPEAGRHYIVTGLVNGDSLTVEMKYQKDGADATPNTSAAGSYEIFIKANANTANYTITTENGTLTIANRPAPPAASGKYRITVLDTVNGEAEADHRSAKAGETITVTVDPDAGYTVEDITILDRNGDKVKFRLKGGKYVFEMPASSVTVQVDFERSENPFVDVPAGKYFYDAVLWALDNGITGGTDATHFSPYASCTRGQLVTFLWRAIGEPAAKKGNNFSDVEKGRYCEKAVSWAAENDIVGGYDDGTFRPDATVTRQQTAAILWRFAKYADMDVSVGEDTNILSYNDALTISDYAFPAIQWAVGAGIMGGDNGNLLPRGTCTRAQIVTMLYRCLAK